MRVHFIVPINYSFFKLMITIITIIIIITKKNKIYIYINFPPKYHNLPQVIATRDSSSMFVPMIVMNLSNALLWVSYGLFGTKDVSVVCVCVVEGVSVCVCVL